MSTITLAVSQNLSDRPCQCLPHSRLMFLLVAGLQLPGSLHDYGFSHLDWTWLHTHNTVFKITEKKITVTLIHCPHAECTWFLSPPSSPIRQRLLLLGWLIPPQFSSPGFDLGTHYYELDRSVLKYHLCQGTF